MLNDHLDWLNNRGGQRLELPQQELSWLTLGGLNLSQSSFKGTNFSNTDLSDTNLFKADLTECTFKSSVLNNTNMREASLSGSDFRFANLRGSNLRDAILDGSNFYGADLSEVDLHGSSLSGVSFYGAKLFGATISEGFVLTGRYYLLDQPGFDSGFLEIFETLRGWYVRTEEFEGDSKELSLFLRRKYGHSDIEERYQGILKALCV